MSNQLTAAPLTIASFPANSAFSENHQTALYAELRHKAATAAGIESMILRVIERGEQHLLEDIADLASRLTEDMRQLAGIVLHIKPNHE